MTQVFGLSKQGVHEYIWRYSRKPKGKKSKSVSLFDKSVGMKAKFKLYIIISINSGYFIKELMK